MRQKSVLTSEQAREIFLKRSSHGFRSQYTASDSLASKYLVSSKAIRDIWKGRSWLSATFDLWSEEDRPSRKAVGRPKGSKDTRPRANRAGRPKHQFSAAIYDSRPSLSYSIEHDLETRQQLPSFKSFLDMCCVSGTLVSTSDLYPGGLLPTTVQHSNIIPISPNPASQATPANTFSLG